ncbi:uncharacterized protein MKZ38_006982 [Zalerion maritima]|uniref:Uncharacterized protein n=1 Tax=Zalerion maritima TaxID=339359 RepID=A0AAD5RIB3_9PEZI|nr:uncharacterized protein MKZ38_006982 [Zalerion maritima]
MPPFRPTPRLAAWPLPEIFSHVRPQQQPQVVRVQRVRLRSAFRLRNLAIGLGVSFLAFNVYDAVVMAPLARATEKAAQGLSRDELDKMDDTPIFIAFPFTERLVEKPPYAGTDPEWAKFVEVAHDKALQQAIKDNLAGICLEAAVKTPWLVQKMGGSNIKVSSWWMYINYPYHPSPEMRIRGLEIGPETISWAEKKVENSTVQRHHRILQPTALAVSMWHFSWALFKQNIQDATRIFGFSDKPSDPAAQLAMQQAAERMAKQKSSWPGGPAPVSPPGSMPPAASRQAQAGPMTDSPNKPTPLSARIKPSGSTTPESKQPSIGCDEDGEGKRFPKPQDLYPYDSFRDSIKGAWGKFFDSWKRRWSIGWDFAPDGAIVVSGLVELKGRKGFATIECLGLWDPKTKDYVPGMVYSKLKIFSLYQQRPLRS